MLKVVIVSIVLGLSGSLYASEGHHHHHHHAQLEVKEFASKPQISLKMHKDKKSGWNLELITENFKFAPEQVNQAHQMGKGHAHLYINGNKITRLYSHWYHLEELPEGKHLIKVNLNTNDHQDYALNGKVIGAEVEVSQE